MTDTELLDLIPLFEDLSKEDDVYSLLQSLRNSVCACVWELNLVYLPVAKAISLQVTIRLIGVVKDGTLYSKDKVMTNYFWPLARSGKYYKL